MRVRKIENRAVFTNRVGSQTLTWIQFRGLKLIGTRILCTQYELGFNFFVHMCEATPLPLV